MVKPAQQLERFHARVREIANTRFIRSKYSPSFSIKWTRGDAVRYELLQPDEEELRSFLLTFRQFISASEPVYINRIYNLLFQALTSGQLRGFLKQSREGWKHVLKTNGIRLMIDEREITPEHIADLWINGVYFHNDSEKQRELERLSPSNQLFVRSQFLMFLASAVNHLFYVDRVYLHAQSSGYLHPPRRK